MAKHFHIPLQSGSDDVLKKMRRRYDRDSYGDLIHRIKRQIPDCGIGADVIVGFPGETDAQFEETQAFLTELPVSYLHVFTYSERPNTPAREFATSVEPRLRFKRSEQLRLLSQKKREAFHRSMIGKVVSVLMEADVENGMRLGFSENYIRVALPAEETIENTFVDIRLEPSMVSGPPILNPASGANMDMPAGDMQRDPSLRSELTEVQ
jgi:threonylcarbamoyladenosine tRNA methylthiotransferase MtaB